MKASEYKKLASKKTRVENVTLPSGAVFVVRVAPIKQWVTVGVLPASLAAKMQTAAKSKDKEAAAKFVLETFTEEDFAEQQKLSRRLLEYCCVEPKLSLTGEDPDAIAAEDLTDDDFESLMQWIWSGGEAGKDLDNFRTKSA